ncbi:hypothetical protein PR202_gb27244 [Eleusine coracana subsp. coracana]|uniref:Protein FAR1-RELATED SEQUENCE n=1 Tax=Eleusine coracana subsp. coracana TaxID=191504 RepID=A0AAV5FVF1_ELECO|nr:hypothetical protein PR202_gb27244 [Eleusine coracana subsp. coracana]
MPNKPPRAVIIDQCRAMQNAIEKIFPDTQHRWCLWHIMEKIPKKLSGYSDYEDIKSTLSNIVYDSLRKSDFERDWTSMINTYGFLENEWLSGLYINRYKWVSVFVKDTSWAGMSTIQRSEGVNAFFDGYVNSKTTLMLFTEQYDTALRGKVEKENKVGAKSFHETIACISYYEVEKQF